MGGLRAPIPALPTCCPAVILGWGLAGPCAGGAAPRGAPGGTGGAAPGAFWGARCPAEPRGPRLLFPALGGGLQTEGLLLSRDLTPLK